MFDAAPRGSIGCMATNRTKLTYYNRRFWRTVMHPDGTRTVHPCPTDGTSRTVPQQSDKDGTSRTVPEQSGKEHGK